MSYKDPEVARAYKATYRATHKEDARAYRETHKEQASLTRRAYYAAHAEEARAAARLYHHANSTEKTRERARIRAKAYYEANKERAQKTGAAYVAAHREQFRAYQRNYQSFRRAQKRGAPLNDLTPAQWQEIKAHYGRRCVYCGRKMQRLTQDHIVPISKGGSHTYSNVVPACQSCNSSKNAGPPPVPVQPLLLTIAPSKKEQAS